MLSQLIHSCSSGGYLHMIRFFFLGSDNSRLAAFSWYGLLVYMTHKLYLVSVCCVWFACLLGAIYVKRTYFFCAGCLFETIHFSLMGYSLNPILFWYMESICSWEPFIRVGFVKYFKLTRIERVSVSVGAVKCFGFLWVDGSPVHCGVILGFDTLEIFGAVSKP